MWPIALGCFYLAILVLALWRAVRQLRSYETIARDPSRLGLGSPSVAIVPARTYAAPAIGRTGLDHPGS